MYHLRHAYFHALLRPKQCAQTQQLKDLLLLRESNLLLSIHMSSHGHPGVMATPAVTIGMRLKSPKLQAEFQLKKEFNQVFL